MILTMILLAAFVIIGLPLIIALGIAVLPVLLALGDVFVFIAIIVLIIKLIVRSRKK